MILADTLISIDPLLGAVALADGARLRARDKRLIAACRELGLAVFEARG